MPGVGLALHPPEPEPVQALVEAVEDGPEEGHSDLLEALHPGVLLLLVLVLVLEVYELGGIGPMALIHLHGYDRLPIRTFEHLVDREYLTIADKSEQLYGLGVEGSAEPLSEDCWALFCINYGVPRM